MYPRRKEVSYLPMLYALNLEMIQTISWQQRYELRPSHVDIQTPESR
jgi:hypothetical protein